MAIRTILVCDKCEAKLELDGPYHVTKEKMKAAGWRNVKEGEAWVIRCKECRG